MLVISNGSPKTGTSWVTQIIQHLGYFEPIPQCYRNPAWRHPSFTPETFRSFRKMALHATGHWYAKQHWRGAPAFKELLHDPDIIIINIIRDLRDVLVSRYYHEKRLGHTKGTFPEWYWNGAGQRAVVEYIDYNRFWLLHEPRPLLFSYEALQSDFSAQIRCVIGEILDIQLLDIDDLHRATSFHRLVRNTKHREPSRRFYRKGTVGDWRTHLDDAILEDVDRIKHNNGYSELRTVIEGYFGYQLAT